MSQPLHPSQQPDSSPKENPHSDTSSSTSLSVENLYEVSSNSLQNHSPLATTIHNFKPQTHSLFAKIGFSLSLITFIAIVIGCVGSASEYNYPELFGALAGVGFLFSFITLILCILAVCFPNTKKALPILGIILSAAPGVLSVIWIIWMSMNQRV